MKKRKNIRGLFMPPMNPDATPVIESTSLPVMPEIRQDLPGQIKNPPKGRGFMPAAGRVKPKVNKAAITKGVQMAPFEKAESVRLEKPDIDFLEQIEKRTRMKKEPGYIVFRMRVQNGEMSVVGARKVEGPFLEDTNLIQGGLTYEATLQNRRVAIGSIVDFGEQRSFPRPDADPAREGHHITTLPSFEFNFKISADRITSKDLPALNVTLYRFKEHVPSVRMTDVPLRAQFEKEVRVVAEMNGIKMDRMRDDVKKSVRQMFKS